MEKERGVQEALIWQTAKIRLYHVFLNFRDSPRTKDTRALTCCPVIFIEQEGSIFCVSIGVFIGNKFLKDHVACTKLECSLFNETHLAEQASIWHAIRKAISELAAEYQRLNDRVNIRSNDNDTVQTADGWIRVSILKF